MIVGNSPLKLENVTLYSADRVRTKHFRFNNDGLFRIIRVTSGGFTFSKDGFAHSVQTNDSVFLYPGNNTDFTGTGEFEFEMIAFSVDSVKYIDRFSKKTLDLIENSKFIFYDRSILNTVGNICKETENGRSILSSELISLLCNELLVYIMRHFNEVPKKADDTETTNNKLCDRVMQYIDSRIFTMKNLNEVASAMGYNYSYISTLFHKTTGITLNNYFKQKRMDSAKDLLCDSKMSISEIARTMNYSSVYAFSKAFKEHFGSSPGHYSGRFTGKDI